MSTGAGGLGSDYLKDNNYESLNGVKDDNIPTPQNDAAKSTQGANEAAKVTFNSGIVPEKISVRTYINALLSEQPGDIPAIPPGIKLSPASISGVISAMERLEKGIKNENLTTASLGDIMTLVAFMLLTSAQDQKQSQVDMRRVNRDIAAATNIVSFELKMQAAKDTRDAAKLEAIGQIVEGAASVASGVASLITLGVGSLNPKNGSASGKVDAAKTKSQQTTELARNIQVIIDGMGKMASGGIKIDVAAKRYSAEKAKINAEVLDAFKQFSQENASIALQNAKDSQQYMDKIISFLEQTFRNIYDTEQSMIRNMG